MGSGRSGSVTPDLFSTASPREPSSRPKNPPTSSRPVLPSDLPAAIRHLNDHELDELQAAVTAEQHRRGNKSPVPDQILSKQSVEGVTLTLGKLNAVRAAFKAGVTPSKIAKQFGVSQAEVRKVIASENVKPQKRL